MRFQTWLLVGARHRKNLLRVLTTASVVALSFISLLSIQGISYATGNSLVSYSLSKLPAGQENITINSSQVISSRAEYQAANQYLQNKLKSISENPVFPEIIYRELSDPHGIHYYFGGVDDFKSSIRLTSGRLPLPCSLSSCEVIQVGGNPKAPPRPSTFGLKIVGRGLIQNNLLFAGTIGPPAGTALLVADGISGATSLASSSFSATDGWVQKIDIKRINQMGTDNYLAKIVAIEDHLSLDFPGLVVTWPQDALSGASDQAVAFAGKLTLLKFAVVTLFLAFLALIAIRQRRDHSQFRTSLSRIGISKSTLAWEVFLETLLPIIGGLFLAGFISLLIPRVLQGFGFQAQLANLYGGWPRYLLLVGVAEALVVGITLYKDSAWRRTQIILVCIALVFFGLYLEQNDVTDSRYLTIPFLYSSGPVVICYLVLRYIISFWRVKRRLFFIIFKEFFGLWQGVAAMVALTGLLAMLAFGYSSGLAREEAATARNQVPLDISLFTGSNLVRPLDLAGVGDYAQLEPKSQAFSILRTGTAIRGQSSVSDSLSLIGMPATALGLAAPELKAFAGSSPFKTPSLQKGIEIGVTKQISVKLTGIPAQIDLLGWFLTPRGTHISAGFVGESNLRTLTLSGAVPPGSSLVAFELHESSNYLSRRLHAIGEGNLSVPEIKGVGSISDLQFDNVNEQSFLARWPAQDFPYAFDGQSRYVQPNANLGIPRVVTDATTASLAANGFLTLLGPENTYFQVQIGAVTSSFPSAGDRFVVMELSSLQSELAQTDLGAIDPIEVWVKTPDPNGFERKLTAAPFNTLLIKSRGALERALHVDPNNVGLLSAYRTSLTLALLLSLLIALSSLPLLYREGALVLLQLETVGYAPRKLRSAVRLTWRVSILTGSLIGVGLGIGIGRLFVSSSIPVLQEAIFLIGAYGIIELCGALISRNFFREKLPSRQIP